MRIDSGTVWVNQHLAIDANIPFLRLQGEPGVGAELGQAGLNEYTQAHIVNAVPLQLSGSRKSGNRFSARDPLRFRDSGARFNDPGVSPGRIVLQGPTGLGPAFREGGRPAR